jgi:Carboxypeptidase regulatory-like domain
MTFAVFVAGVFLLMPTGALRAAEVICSQQQVKPVRHIWGIIIDQSGAPVSRVKVSILKGQRELDVVETGENGEFSFDELDAGNYEVQAEKKGFRTFRFPIVLAKPERRRKKALEVELIVASEACPGVHLVKPKAVERRLHPSGRTAKLPKLLSGPTWAISPLT